MAASSEIDPRLEWMEGFDLESSLMSHSKEGERNQNGVEMQNMFSSLNHHRRITPQKYISSLNLHTPFDWTPEMRLGSQSNTFTPWMNSCHSTPTRSSSLAKFHQTPFSALLGGQANAQSPTRNSTSNGQESLTEKNTIFNPVSSNIVRLTGKKTSLTSGGKHSNGKEKKNKMTEHDKMPPPPLPKPNQQKEYPQSNVQQQTSSRNFASSKGYMHIGMGKYPTPLPLRAYEKSFVQSTTLPPQYRALYNASTVGPARYARDILLANPCNLLSLSKSLSKRTLANANMLRSIANNLSERDAFTFALSSPSVYRALDVSWWKTKFPIKEEEQVKKSAWVYLWPKSDGYCSFCTRWMRIVMHEPSKAHVCLDCMQLTHFKVIRFSAARMRYKLNNTIAISLLSQLPSVQDQDARYFWVCHLEWVEAHCQNADTDEANDKAIALAKKSKVYGDHLKKNGKGLKRKVEDYEKELVDRSRQIKRKESNENVFQTLNTKRSFRNDYATLQVGDEDITFAGTSSELSSYDGDEDADAEGDTDEEYNPETTVESEPYLRTTTSIIPENVKGNNKRSRTSTTDGTLTVDRSQKKETSRRTKSSPSPAKHFEDQERESEAEEEDVESRQQRISDIMRDVRKDYLMKEIRELGCALSDVSRIPDMFINGQWNEVQECGIQQNDFKAMAKWMQAKDLLGKGNIREPEVEMKI